MRARPRARARIGYKPTAQPKDTNKRSAVCVALPPPLWRPPTCRGGRQECGGGLKKKLAIDPLLDIRLLTDRQRPILSGNKPEPLRRPNNLNPSNDAQHL